MRRIAIFAAAALLLTGLALASVGSAGPFGRRGGPGERGGPGGPGFGFIEQHAEELGVDEAALEKIRAIVEEARSEGQEIHVALRDAHEAMRELLSQDSPDRDAVMSQAEAIGALEIEARKHRLAAFLDVRDLLTPEQRAQLMELRGEARAQRFAPVMEACGADIEALCPDTEPGRPTARCLRESRDQLSEECHAALREHGPRGRGRRGPRGP
jgi:Spy/CpxP family protein refolding chaperone